MKIKWEWPLETIEIETKFGHMLTGCSRRGLRPNSLMIDINELRGCGMSPEELGQYMIHLMSRVKCIK